MKDGVIAVVAGKEIKQEEFDLFVENLPQDRKAYLQYPGFKERLLDQYLALYTFSADAVEQGLDKTEEFARILENTRRDILAQLAMREAVKNVKVTEEEAKEYYEANPVTETTICAGMVGVPMLDPEIDTMLYLTDACTELELFQDGNHQKMGLTCTDCHMPQTEAADGATYTHHNMTQSPLENPAALEKCLTCHKSQGVEDADAMVTFVKGKMDELAQIQQATKTKLDEFHAKLAEVVAAGNADETKLQAAKDAYNLANVYFLYQGTAMRPTDGSMAAMNFSKSVEQLQKADDAIAEGMAQIA